MLSETWYIFSKLQKKSIGAFTAVVLLCFIVSLEWLKRYVYKKLETVTGIQSAVIFGLIYFISLPFTLFLYIFAGQKKSAKKETILNLKGKINLNDFDKMY